MTTYTILRGRWGDDSHVNAVVETTPWPDGPGWCYCAADNMPALWDDWLEWVADPNNVPDQIIYLASPQPPEES